MTKLSDIQLLLLTTAASRTDGSLLPPPETLGTLNARIRKSITALIARELVEEKTGAEPDCVWREEDGEGFGAFITDAGREAVGMPASQPVPSTKIEQVLGLLRREGGATLAELAGATGWLPHTTRATLTRLRQKGHVLDKGTRDGVTAYIIQAAA